ncbi:methionyl-tRNA formyltransferase [Prochlorococcus sp. MIT 0801]|uniref:methionyl-tRNA formyltransferase n=1 Tax=Prochlorococcus sp. MIT 0801 TaxID=1501269 RepID=UPI0004F6DED5|nr:methionyl-tRNA formyltransferase [Prochlorococcus sp. MIT 0801]AIQ97156.1 Methionyl-tRNA formyltransferase [Prochlorococcus sp. MIT 0801]
MKIVFWGTPKYAAENLNSIVKAGHEVIAVVTQPDKKRGRGKSLSPSPVKEAAEDLSIPVYSTYSISKDQKTKEILINLKADVYLVVAFGQILPKEILDQPNLGCWNSHASLLPAWRGAAPIQWSIINDDAKTGVCIMSMEEGLDTGPVIEQESTIIKDTDNLEILTNRLSIMSSKLLLISLEKIKLTKGLNKSSRLNQLNAIPQTKLKGTPSYARQITKEDNLIDWNQKARKIIKKIKGLYPNAYTYYNSKRIKILEVFISFDKNQSKESQDIKSQSNKHIIPGEIVMINKKNGLKIMTKDYPIIIKYAQLEGKKPTDGYTLSIQTNFSINDKLGV